MLPIIFSGRPEKILEVLDGCKQYIQNEGVCSLALANSAFKTDTINAENSLIDAVTGGLTTASCYMATFLVEDRLIITFIHCLNWCFVFI